MCKKTGYTVTFISFRIILTLLWVLLALAFLAACDSKNEDGIKESNGFSISENVDGTLTIINYTGDVSTVSIPATIDGESVTHIGDYAFEDCVGLESVIIPESVTDIGMAAFSGCTGLNSVTISESVTSIGKFAFRDCISLNSITIPKSVASAGDYMFQRCYRLVHITNLSQCTLNDLEDNIGQELRTDASVAFVNELSTDSNGLITYQIKKKKYIIGYVGEAAVQNITDDEINGIYAYAFLGCTSLTSVNLPDSITDIGSYAFSGCTGLTAMNIPESVNVIGAFAFSDCTGLKSVTIQNTSGWKAGLTAVDVSDDAVVAEYLTTIPYYGLKWTRS